MLFAYFGPETMMPLASILVGITGVVLAFWRSIVQFGRNIFRRVWPAAPAKVEKTALADQAVGDGKS